MRFMLMIKATGYSEAGVEPSREYAEARQTCRQSMAQAGVLLAAEELRPSTSGVRITYSALGGEPSLQTGPFPTDTALMAEYALIEVQSEDEALNWALRMPVPAGPGEYEIELRRLEEPADAWREPRIRAMEADLQDQLDMLQKMVQPLPERL
ncbi:MULTISPECIES: YciI family protein [Paenibacillus]|jgi:hypothetical protein|uniref:YciI family protein n=1 Tax=Paenibacillus oceani TaxID=2772510 RepID=A0A927C7U7_9BACL|nr:YciI family protein [Paenibacillus oceani]MBD2862449.1 YciI family protein [Paenibacillus oceani]